MGDESPRVQEGLQVGVSEPPGLWAAQCPVSLGLTVTQLPALFFFSPLLEGPHKDQVQGACRKLPHALCALRWGGGLQAEE